MAAISKKAVVWVAGLSGNNIDETLDGLSQRITAAYEANNIGTAFTVTDPVDSSYMCGGKIPAKICTISRIDANQGKVPLIDIVHYDWEQDFLGKVNAFSLGWRAVLFCLVLTTGFGRLIFSRAFQDKSKIAMEPREQLQMFAAMIYLGIIAAGLAALLQAIFSATVFTPAAPPGNSEKLRQTRPELQRRARRHPARQRPVVSPRRQRHRRRQTQRRRVRSISIG